MKKYSDTFWINQFINISFILNIFIYWISINFYLIIDIDILI